MNHVFAKDEKYYQPTFTCEAAQRCFEDPSSIASLKVHGECCLLSRGGENNNEWIFCTRYDAKEKPLPDNAVHVPDGAHPAKFQNHSYCFLPLDKDLIVGKGKRKTRPGPDTYASIAHGAANGDIPDPSDDDCPAHITVEWVGRKHQGNVDNLDVDHGIYVHGSTIVDLPERTFEAVQKMAQTISIEGVILFDAISGERFKLRFDCFPESVFAKNCKQAVTAETTTIKPKVMVPSTIGEE